MITKKKIVDEIEQLPDSDLQELHLFIEKLIKQHRSSTKDNVMAQLRQIKIEAASDFSVKVEL